MAFAQGVKMKESHANIVQKLNLNGECLQNSTSALLLEMKVLNKLIYKSKNTHSKEKFFKGLERIKKCLNKWKLLNLHNKVLTMSTNTSDTEFFCEILNEITLGGQLSIRIITLCQETVQYSLAYLSRGFFIALHVTFLSLLSRLWVLQKDCLKCVIDCYQPVRSLIQLTESDIDLKEFPESLTSCLGEDVQKIFDAKNVDESDAFSVVNSSNPIFQQLFSDKNDSDTSMIFNDDVTNDELDLGEPVENMRAFHSAGCPTPTVAHNKTMSDLKTNLTSKFDLESAGCKNGHANSPQRTNSKHCTNDNFEIIEGRNKLERLLKDGTAKYSHRYQLGKQRKPKPCRKSDNKMVVRRITRSFHRRGNSFFIKKTQCLYTLRTLLAKKDFAVCSTRKVHVLLKCLSFAGREYEALPNERKMLLRTQRCLQRELRKRKSSWGKGKANETSLSKATDVETDEASGNFNEICGEGDGHDFGIRGKTDTHAGYVGTDRKSWARSKKINNSSPKNEKKFANNPLLIERRVNDQRPNESFQRIQTVDSKSDTFPRETHNEWTNGDTKTKRDEIDDIFGSLGL